MDYKYSSLEEKILFISRCEYCYFLNKSNVVGIGLGYKIKNGFNTYKKCIKVFVSKKISPDELPNLDLVPLYFKGIATDVHEIGEFTMCSLRNRVRPVTCGYNISPSVGCVSGTFGCIVTDGKFNYILSNAHVLATSGDTPIGTPITQPGRKYGGTTPNDTVAELSKYVPTKYISPTRSPANLVDCAIAKITDVSQISSQITFLGHIKGITSAKLNETVQKVGASTGLTKGKIIALGVTTTIDRKRGKCIFKNQILTNSMGESGDSGSLLLDEHMHAIGLLMSAGTSCCGYNPIGDVLKSLNVTLVTK